MLAQKEKAALAKAAETEKQTFQRRRPAFRTKYSTFAADQAITCPICGGADALEVNLRPRSWQAKCTRCNLQLWGRYPKL